MKKVKKKLIHQRKAEEKNLKKVKKYQIILENRKKNNKINKRAPQKIILRGQL